MMLFEDERADGELIVVTGATRYGKTAWVAQQVKDARRLLVWDSKNEWGKKYNCRVITTWEELAKACMMTAPDERLAFQCKVTRENFEVFCELALIFVQMRVSTIIIEEIADVANIGKASQNWGELSRKSLCYQPTIYALTNSPEESDKTMLRQATRVHSHFVNTEASQKYIARLLHVPVEKITALKKLEWIERNNETKMITEGIVVFDDARGRRAAASQAAARKRSEAGARPKSETAKSKKTPVKIIKKRIRKN